MEKIAIIDTETTGLSAKTDKIIEVAAVLYDVPSRSIIAQASTLLPSRDNAAFNINNIPIELLSKLSLDDCSPTIDVIQKFILQSDAIMAHNASFDRGFLEASVFFDGIVRDKKWVCSRSDIKWPVTGSLKLTAIVEGMGLPVISAHRALPDCVMLADCLSKLDNLEQQLGNTLLPRSLYYAHVSYDFRQLAKNAGFQWDTTLNKWKKMLTDAEAMAITSFAIVKA